MSTQFVESVRDDSVNRRAVVGAVAWIAPVVAATVAAQLVAASTRQPTPVPPAAVTALDGGTSIATYRGGSPNEIRMDQTTSGFGFFIFDEDGAEFPAGTYVASTPTITVMWEGTGDFTPVLRALRGWTQSAGSTASGTSGSISFLYPGQLLNGAANRVPAPYVALRPTSGTVLGPTQATVQAGATYFDTIASVVTI